MTDMNTEALLKDAYQRFWAHTSSRTAPVPCVPLNYNAYGLDNAPMQYKWAEDSFTRELLNGVNEFGSELNRLALWEATLSEFDEQQQLEIRYEFTRASLYFCLHQPAELKARLAFSAVQLCYVAGLSASPRKTNKLKSERSIDLSVLKSIQSDWASLPRLVAAIERIAGVEFCKATGDYRNRRQHRLAPGLDFGHIGVVSPDLTKDGAIIFEMGEVRPVQTAVALPLLVEQHSFVVDAVPAYWDLVLEHVRELKRN